MRGESGFPIRLRFTKRGKVRFIGHRDVARAFERAFRIVELPLAFTEGFSPRPKVSFGLALSVGHESDAEYFDVELTRPVDVDALAGLLSAALPEGVAVTGVAPLMERAPALQESVTHLQYQVEVGTHDGDVDGVPAMETLRRAVEGTVAAEALPVARLRKGVESVEDVRPVICELRVVDADVPTIEMYLSTRPRLARPAEIVAALDTQSGGAGLVERRVLRTHRWIERTGARHEPLEADARRSLAEARA
jgi:radical SAM-linked protein